MAVPNTEGRRRAKKGPGDTLLDTAGAQDHREGAEEDDSRTI